MKKKDNKTKSIAMAILGLIFIVCWYFSLPTAEAQPIQKNQSEWVEVNSIELPENLEIFSGITKNGNPKYWIEIEGIKMFLSPTNKEHYINGTATIILVEWYNKSTDRYKYTTRQKKENKQNE